MSHIEQLMKEGSSFDDLLEWVNRMNIWFYMMYMGENNIHE